MDAIKTHAYKQRGRDQWMYEFETESGKKYEVYYTVTQYGHVREVLQYGGVPVLDREWKIGWNQEPTVSQIIMNGGTI